MLDSKLAVAAAFGTEAEAEMAKGALASADIEAMIIADSAGGMEPNVAFSHGGYQLLVKEEELETAKAMLVPRDLPPPPPQA